MNNSTWFAWLVALALTNICVSQDSDSVDVDNPYRCPQHWEEDRILDFLLSAEEKPRTIRRRNDFVLAIEDASLRLRASDQCKPAWKRLALLSETRALHYHACWGNSAADQRLAKLISEMEKSKDKRVQAEYEFLQLEKKVIEFESTENSVADPTSAKVLLKQALDFCESKPMTDRHIRLASNIVRVINLFEEVDAEKDGLLAYRLEQFELFGKQFEKSSDLRMSRYGKTIQKSDSNADGSQWVGKPAEISGLTLSGDRFDIASLKGNVVIVDFWATWCGPCIREMPKLAKFHQAMRDKGLEVIGVNLDEDIDAVRKFVESNQVPWQNIVREDASQLAEAYRVQAIPTLMLIDKNGNIVAFTNQVDSIHERAKELVEE